MTKNASTGRFDVLNSCAMENCGEQDLTSTTASSKCTAAGPLGVFFFSHPYRCCTHRQPTL